MKCTDCPYYWAECNKRGEPIEHPSCKYQWDDGYAPCEIEEQEQETPDDYYGE